ncbi:MAG: Disulfide bond formation protein B [Candidatus Tokpelaia sp. JSC188]|nr:MAG: Disulfide bond formation protein B [Candidatus Tokpelaia sp. JSC188]
MPKPASHFFCSTRLVQIFLAIFLFIAMSGTVLSALGFQYIIGLMPCKLCLMERTPYYIGALLMIVTIILFTIRILDIYIRRLFIATFLLMFYDFALSVYHVGMEWMLWLGPRDCILSDDLSMLKTVSNLLDNLNTMHPNLCSKAVGYFLGLSMAGWNSIAAFSYSAIAALAVFFSYK